MVNWFEKAKEILQNKENEKNDKFTILFEDFFDVLMTVYNTSCEGKVQILENFIWRTCTFIADKRINIYIQQEAVRKLNTMLDAMPRDTRKKIISAKEMLQAMNDMGRRILDAGDYDLQVAITEALCRMTSEKQRGELASQWFSMEFVTNAFKGIKDSEFETDCRKFLNQVNGMLGDKRRVFTYPCLSANLDKHELQIPADDNLEEFWIDFNTGSRSISFYVAADGEGHQWETVCVPEEEVKTYIIEEKDKNKLLTIHLCNPMSVGVQEGDIITLHFDSALEILDAVKKVYGVTKRQDFRKKNTISVSKTTLHVIFDESGSQIIVPESQISPLKENVVGKGDGSFLQSSRIQTDFIQRAIKEDFQTFQSKITPGKKKMSEASMVVPSTSRLGVQSPLPLVNTSTPRRCRVKKPLQIMSSLERNNIFSIPERNIMNFSIENNVSLCSTTKSHKKNSSVEKHIPVENVINMCHSDEDADFKKKQQRGELINIVPDSQPIKNSKQLSPDVEDNSFAAVKTQKRQMCWIPETIISHCNKHNSSQQETSNLSDIVVKQKAFSSIFEMNSTEVKSKLHCDGKITEQRHHETNTVAVKSGKRNSAESRNSLKPLDEKISKSSNKKLVSTKPEVNINATQMEDSSLIHLGCPKSVTATNDDDEFDVYYRKKTVNKKTNQKSKPKAMAEAAESLINNISDRYKQKDGSKSTRQLQPFSKKSTSFNTSGFSVSKKKNQNNSGDMKTSTLLNITSKHLMDDVYNFNLSGFDEPTIKLGIQEFHLTKLEATKLEATADLSKKMNHDNQRKSIGRKRQSNKNRTNRNKKHLFSDTDTEYRGDDTKTDISWLRESNRKPKPQLVDYSRMRKKKKYKIQESKKTSPPMSTRETFQQNETKKNTTPISKNQSDSDREERARLARLKPKRKAALAKKSYKELSDSESGMEEESSENLVEKGTLKENPEPKSIKTKAVNQLKARQNILSSEPPKVNLVNQHKNTAISKDSGPKQKMESSSLPSFESPPSLEIMRCCEEYREEQSTEAHVSPGRSSLSSLLSYEKEFTSEKEKSLGDTKNVSDVEDINIESIHLKQLSENCRKLEFGTEDLSPASSSFSLPRLSPLNTGNKIASNQDTDVTKVQKKICDIDEAVNRKHYSLKKSSDTELNIYSENLMKNRGKASVSVSQSSTPRISREDLRHEEPLAHIHESGPTVYTNFKRLYQEDSEVDSDEEEIRKQKTKRKLLPRKLFKTENNPYKVSESMSTVSVNDISVFDGDSWDADSSSIGMIYQKLHKELARKIQSRTKRIDNFTKQSLKTVHQHMDTMNSELHKHRLQNLKTSFEKNIYDTADCEEFVFVSEMHQMKAHMKGIQERFLKEMHEEELLNVRKGLQSLFMDENRHF
ncbi:synaptonemal complex protein 2 isoform X3 [Anolis carolinensis]|uniref:synaptonemal complex protein 2 isoform X3 n=1 Tax=Anolis carolinensis TaxID=28377 RepID=UPI002F2B56B5